jgi:hypothetical protein
VKAEKPELTFSARSVGIGSMKASLILVSASLVLSMASSFANPSQGGSKSGVRVHQSLPEGENSSVLIETTKNAKVRPDYEIVEGEDEISGDPTAGTKAAYASWKEACKEWKNELKENNKGDRVLVSNCGSASFQKDDASGAGAGVYVYRSKAKYKIRVRIRD